MNILVIEDEKSVATSIKNLLEGSQKVNSVTICHDFDTACSRISAGSFDILLMDIFLGKNSHSGLDLCRSVRQNNDTTPIIIITGFNSLKYLEEAFNLGANDYIRKPFDTKEFRLRVERWVNFSKKVEVKNELNYGDLAFDNKLNRFLFKGNPINLTKRNKSLLKIFIKQPEELLNKYYLQKKLWGDHEAIDKNRNIRSNIQNLRRSLPLEFKHWIQTVRGEGYILKKAHEKNTDPGR